MRFRLSCLAVTYLAGVLIVSGVGCGSNELEKPVNVTKPVDPMNDMPGYKDMQDKMKTQSKPKAK